MLLYMNCPLRMFSRMFDHCESKIIEISGNDTGGGMVMGNLLCVMPLLN